MVILNILINVGANILPCNVSLYFLSPGYSDFEVNIIELTFSPKIRQNCFNTTIIDDNLYEYAEDFFVNITTADSQFVISPMITVLTILDNDGKKTWIHYIK